MLRVVRVTGKTCASVVGTVSVGSCVDMAWSATPLPSR